VHVGAGDAGELDKVVDQHPHALRRTAHPVQVVASGSVELRRAVFQQRLAEAVDGTQRRAQVVGHRVAESLQLLVHRRQLGVVAQQPLVQGLDLVAGALAVGDVAHGSDDQRPLLRSHRAEADLDRKLAAVGALAEEFPALAHGAGAGCNDEGVAVTDMPAAEAFGHQDLDRLADKAVARIAEQLLGLRVDQFDAALGIGDDDRIGCRLQQGAEAGLAVAQFLFGLLGPGDVANGGDDQRPALGLHRAEADGDGELAAVGTPPGELQAFAHRTHPRRGQETAAVADVAVMQAFGHQVFHRPADKPVPRVAEQALGLSVHEADVAFAVHDHDGIGRRLEHRAQARLTVEQGLLVCLAFRHVAQDAGKLALSVDRRCRQRQLERELAAVLAAAHQFDRPAEHPLFAAGNDALQTGLVGRVVALRHQQGHRLADQLVALVAEQTLGLRIHQHDAAIAAGDHDAVRRRLEEGTEMRLAAGRGGAHRQPLAGLRRPSEDSAPRQGAQRRRSGMNKSNDCCGTQSSKAVPSRLQFSITGTPTGTPSREPGP